MKITESRLRKIVRKELKRLDEIAVNDGEGSLASHQIAPGGENVLWNIWQSDAMGWTLTILGALADMFPGVGTAASMGIAGLNTIRSIGVKDWLGAFFAMISAVPAVGDAVAILARAAKAGKAVGAPVLKKLLLFITGVTDSWIRSQIIAFMNDPQAGAQAAATNVPAAAASILAAKNQLQQSLQATLAKIESSPAPATQPAAVSAYRR